MKNPILIFSAMDMEASLLLRALAHKVKHTIDGYDYYEGKINGVNLVLCASGIMPTNVAIATYIGIKHFHPSSIILEGSAGGYTKELHVSDIVLAEKSLDITKIITPVKEKGLGSNSLDWKVVEFDEYSENFYKTVKYENASEKLIENISKITYPYGKLIKGIIGSGSMWNNEIDRIISFHDNYGIICEDMETDTVYSICNKFNIPVVSIRVISNNILTKENFNSQSILHLQEFLIKNIHLIEKTILL